MEEGNFFKSKRQLSKECREKKTRTKKSYQIQQYYPCDKCKRKLKSELSFKKHQEMHNSKVLYHKCHICKEGSN